MTEDEENPKMQTDVKEPQEKELTIGEYELPLQSYEGDSDEHFSTVVNEVLGKLVRTGKLKIDTVKDEEKGTAVTRLIVTV